MSGNKSNGDNDNGNIVSFFSWTMAAPVTVIIRQTVVFKRFGNLALWGATRGEVIQNSAWRKHQFVHWRPEWEFLLQEKQSSRPPSELATLTGASARLLAREQWGAEPAKAFRVWLIQQQSIGIDDQPNLAFVAPMFSVRQKFIKNSIWPPKLQAQVYKCLFRKHKKSCKSHDVTILVGETPIFLWFCIRASPCIISSRILRRVAGFSPVFLITISRQRPPLPGDRALWTSRIEIYAGCFMKSIRFTCNQI